MVKVNARTIYTYVLIGLVVILSAVFVFAGSLTNTEGPISTSYTLTDIYNLIKNNDKTANTSNHSLSPTTEPTATSSYSVSQIYAELANLVEADKVATGTVYLGVTGDYGNTNHASSSVDIIPSSLTPTTEETYSLDDIYHLITDNDTAASHARSTPPSEAPAESMHTLSEIYTALVGLGVSKAPYVNPDTTYLGAVGSFDINADRTPPVVTQFVASTYLSNVGLYLTIYINEYFSNTHFTATDDTAVTGYLITETDTTPALDSSWSATSTITYTFDSPGEKTLYAWAKDAAGNISLPKYDLVNITPSEWSDATNDIGWDAAKSYCAGLIGGGWSVPTGDDLRQALVNQFAHGGSDPGGFIDDRYYRGQSLAVNEETLYNWSKLASSHANYNDSVPSSALVRCIKPR